MRSWLRQLLAVGPELAAYILTIPLLGAKGAYAITQTAVPSPKLDLSQLGRVALAGDFDSISLYQYEGQNENTFNSNGSESLLTRYPDGSFQSLGLSDAYIEAMCPFRRGGQLKGVVLGGNFTSIAGVQADSVALWDPNTGGVTPLTGISGRVSALYCDDESGTVYVGGMFSAGNSTNAMAWTTQWTNLPFSGFNGPVSSITKNQAGNIVFGGSFDGLGSSENGTESVTQNSTQLQVVNLSGGVITAFGNSSTEGFNDPRNIICKTGGDGPGNTWLLEDGIKGWWDGTYSFGFTPTKLRLYNTNYQGRGTKAFAFEDFNTGGILELNYTDSTGKSQTCAASCPLPQGNTTYQDFYFQPAIGTNHFRLWINEWYGDGAGLAGIEMFQEDIYAFAVNDYNEPQCDDVSQSATSTINPAQGVWRQVTNNGSTSSDYLSAYLTANSSSNGTSVMFSPNIQASGNYSILVYTPGCLGDGTCSSRGEVNLTGSMTSNNPPVSVTISQTNYYDKFDQIYYGYVDVDTGSFRPTVTLAPIAGQSLPQTIVAQRVRFDLVTSTGGLNGLFEYNPNQATVSTNFSTSAINAAGDKLNSGAIVSNVVQYGDSVYVAGNFSGNGMSNIMAVNSKATALPNGGLNDYVAGLYLNGSTMYLGGSFTDTVENSMQGLNNCAIFDIGSSKWSAMGAGVNSGVTWIVPVALNITTGDQENCIALSGNFTSINAFGGSPARATKGFAVWVPSKNNWLNNIPDVDIALTGQLQTMTAVPGMQWPLYAGQISTQNLGLGDAAALASSNGNNYLQSLGIHIQPANASSSTMRKRAIESGQNATGVYTGLFYDQNNLNVTVLGGHFTATASDGSSANNLMFASTSGSTQKITGAKELDSGSTIAALDTTGTLLFAGGSLTGSANNNKLNGLIVYDLSKMAIASPQPPALAGSNVVVNAIAAQPSSSDVYVGGNFAEAGSLPCATLCYYDTSTQQWNTPGIGLSGTITSMFWSSKTMLYIAGDLTVDGNKTSMATYDSKKQKFQQYTSASLPGPIDALVPANSNYNQFWAAGVATNNNSAFLSYYKDNSWTGVGGLGAGTTIRGVQVLNTKSNHGSTDFLSNNELLMVVGNINVPNYGNASAVLFNGTTFEPFALTSKQDGTQGSIGSLFVSNPNALMKMGGHHLAVGFVVLIGLAISLGLIFLIVVAGILIERARRRREGYVPMSMDKNGNLARIPPSTLLGGLNGEKGSPPKI